MDDVLCDFKGHYLYYKLMQPSIEYPQSTDGFFLELLPIKNAIESVKFLDKYFDLYFLSAPSVHNPFCYKDKRLWIEEYFGFDFCHKLILSPHKHLSKGDYLIDDNHYGKGQDKFEGELIHFGSAKFPDWKSILVFLCDKYHIPLLSA